MTTVPDRVADLNRVMAACGGGLELVEHDAAGAVHLRLLGMCTGCSCRAVTTATTLRTALGELPDVTDVVVANSRISHHAAQRIALAMAEARLECPGSP